MKKIVFVDRDGTIVREPPDKQVDSLEKLDFVPGIIAGLRSLIEAGFSLVMVSNQDGLGGKGYPRKSFTIVQKKLLGILAGEGIRFDRVLICPHRKDDQCDCRKPRLGLVRDYAGSRSFDRSGSFVLGDRTSDLEFARNLGIRSVFLSNRKSTLASYTTSSSEDACRYIAASARSASISRKTTETAIHVHVAIDGRGMYDISTGIRFFDHMLSQLAKHSGIDIELKARGDLDVDEHHTVEDVGIVLGTALRRALGDKGGIERFAAPLDESVAAVVLDLSGRRYVSFQCDFKRESVGNLPTELVEDFFRAFADGLGATLHIDCRGRNDHHKIEAIFKSVGRALRAAVSIDPRARRRIPSTKGIL